MSASAEPAHSADQLVLDGFARALRSEAHVLQWRPELAWQQLYNRLQWEHDGIADLLVHEARLRREHGTGGPWLRTRNPFRESLALVRTLDAGGGPLRACEFSPDGSFLVSGGADGVLRLWDPATGLQLGVLEGHEGSINSCAIAGDGSFILSASGDETLKLWDPATGDVLRTLTGHTGSVTACAIAVDGSFIVSASADKTLKLWSPADGRNLHTMSGHTDTVTGCAVAPDSSFVVSASKDWTLRLWEPPTVDEARILVDYRLGPDEQYDSGNEPLGRGCAVAPDGSYVVSGWWEKSLKVSSAKTGEELRILAGQARRVVHGMLATQPALSAHAVAPDGSFAVAASEDMTLRLWDLTSGEEWLVLEGHSRAVSDCAISPDGALVVSASDDGTLKLWQPDRGRDAEDRSGHTAAVLDCTFAPDGSYVLSASGDELWVWDGATGRDLRVLEMYPHKPAACAVSPDGAYFLSGGADETMCVWDPHVVLLFDPRTLSREEVAAQARALKARGIHPYPAEPDVGHGVTACAIAPEDAYVVSAGWDILKIWEPAALKNASSRELVEDTRTLRGHTRSVWDCAVAPDGSYVVSASHDHTLRLWDPTTGDELRVLEGHTAEVNACAISPDGAFLASASHDHTVRLWDLAAGVAPRILAGHERPVLDCAVAADGSFVVSAGADCLKLWHVASGAEIRTFPLVGVVWSVSCHPFLPALVCGDGGGNVYLLDLVDYEFGPVVVTPGPRGRRRAVRCPKCRCAHRLRSKWLGEIIECPTQGCGMRLQVNPFAATDPFRARRRSLARRFGWGGMRRSGGASAG